MILGSQVLGEGIVGLTTEKNNGFMAWINVSV